MLGVVLTDGLFLWLTDDGLRMIDGELQMTDDGLWIDNA